MKNYLLLFLISIPIILNSQMNVNIHEAENWGQYVVNKYFPKNIKYEVISIQTISNESQIQYYVCHVYPVGFVLVSGNKLLHPILGYSWESNFIYPLQQTSIALFMNRVKKIEENNKTADIHPLWNNNLDKYLNNEYRSVDPLILTKWDQGIYYNQFCPKDPAGPDGRCVTGCVATALAQVINYFRWPNVGEGEYTDIDTTYGHLYVNYAEQNYFYNEMPLRATRENQELAKLMYTIGVACDMYYGPHGSGMYNHKAAYALRNFFRYDPTTEYLFRDETHLDWDSLLRDYLDQKIPLYYGGWSDTEYVSGHAFVIDGYQDTMVYHVNWGWGGAYDGYFNINNLTPGGSDFTYKHEVVINMRPNGQYPVYCNGTDTLKTLDGTIDDGSGPFYQYLPNTHCSWLIQPFDSIENIKLDFLKLDLPDPNDFINVYNGDSNSGILVATITGTDIPNTITVNGKSAFIEFISNDNEEGDGFLLSYSTTVHTFCTANITEIVADSGVITDGSGPYNYRNGNFCRWKLLPANAQQLVLTFNLLDIDSTDNLRIKNYDGSIDMEFKGNTLPPPILVSSFPVNIYFTSSATYSAQGFEIIFRSSLESINDYQYLVSIYPNPFSNAIFFDFVTDGLLKIYTSDGKLMFSNYYNRGSYLINTDEWASGIYFIHFNDNNNFFSKKIIKIYE
ncbi:MAG: C10 family peptidase [Bacteroidales bacterium]|jgi:hypothetical protein